MTIYTPPTAGELCPHGWYFAAHCGACWNDAMTAPDVGSPEQCVECDARHESNEDFTYRGFHFCINCISALVSWFMDGGFKDDPEQFSYVLEPGECERMTSLGRKP